MACIKYLTKTLLLSLALVCCSSTSSQKTFDNRLHEFYTTIQQNLKEGNWKQAITQLKLLDKQYPFSPYFEQVQLDLIYAYYKNADLDLALATINRFIRLNPSHPKIDYAMYMRGLTNMALDKNRTQSFFRMNHFDRDPRYARDAFNDFSKLIQNYSSSHYVADANRRLSLLKDRMAKYEYSIASYYAHLGAWVAVVNRVTGMLQDYPDSLATSDGLKLMENAYRKMKMNTQADKVAKVISAKNSSRNLILHRQNFK